MPTLLVKPFLKIWEDVLFGARVILLDPFHLEYMTSDMNNDDFKGNNIKL